MEETKVYLDEEIDAVIKNLMMQARELGDVQNKFKEEAGLPSDPELLRASTAYKAACIIKQLQAALQK